MDVVAATNLGVLGRRDQMSVYSLVGRLGAQRTDVAVASQSSAAAEYAKAVIAYIPSEGIAAFLAVLGLGTGLTSSAPAQAHFWAQAAFVVGSLAIPVVALLRFAWNDQEPKLVSAAKAALGVVIAWIAFVLYSMATPGGPWTGTFQGAEWTAIGGVGALLFGLFAPLVAMRLGLDSSGGDAQAITFPAISRKKRSELPLRLSATATSGLPVTFKSTTPAVCTVAEGSVHWVSAGECRVVASQAGGGRFGPAPEVANEFELADD